MIAKFRNLFFYLGAACTTFLSTTAHADLSGSYFDTPYWSNDNLGDRHIYGKEEAAAFARSIGIHNGICTGVFGFGGLMIIGGLHKSLLATRATDAALKSVFRAQALSFGIPGLLLLIVPFMMNSFTPVWLAPAVSALGFFLFFHLRAKKAKAKAAEAKAK